ncbi:MAG TPA: sigma factor, partial [Ktedonobacteraceae bacterium]
MATLKPMDTVCETSLATLAIAEALPGIDEPNFDADRNALLAENASKRTTKSSIEMESLLYEEEDALFNDRDDVEESSEGDALEELPIRSTGTRSAATRQTTGSEDAFQSYLRDIRPLGLLTHEEEIDLARQVAAGDDQALRKLIESNVRLVIAIARRYISTGVPLIDLIQEGNLGLMRAAEKFDYRRGCHFG